MSYWSAESQEDVQVLSTNSPRSRLMRSLLKIVGVFVVLAIIGGAVIGWRYYTVQQRLKRDLTVFVRSEEHIRSLGGVNAVPELLLPGAPYRWWYRYEASVEARKGRPEPVIHVKSVKYDGVNARVHLAVDEVAQYRHYRLLNHQWRRAPFEATGWGVKHDLTSDNGLKIVYWDKDSSFARELAADLPDLASKMAGVGLNPTGTALLIIPKELDVLVRPARLEEGWVLNSPHVDLVPQAPGDLSPEQELRLALAQRVFRDARNQHPVLSNLSGANRLQNAIDDVLAWQWATGDVSAAAVSAWADMLKGYWVSPARGLNSDLMTKLPPEAPDAAARALATSVLRSKGETGLSALSAALTDAKSWDEAYEQALGMSMSQAEEAAQTLLKDASQQQQ